MKIWQATGTILLSLIMAICVLVSTIYYVLEGSVLDSGRTKDAMSNSGLYGQIRTQHVLPALTKQILPQAEFGPPLSEANLKDSLAKAFPEQSVEPKVVEIVDSTYLWLNKKSPSIDFSIDISPEKRALLAGLSAQVKTNLEKLPVCTTFSVSAQSLAEVTCISPFGTRETYHAEIMGEISQRLDQAENVISSESVGLDKPSLGSLRNVPDYLSYLWALNFITLPLAGLIALYLIIKRRGIGLLLIGVVISLTALGCILLSIVLPTIKNPAEELVRPYLIVLLPLVQDQLRLFAIAGGALGVIITASGITWMKLQHRKK